MLKTISIKIAILSSFLIIVIFLSQSSDARDETIADEWIVENYNINYKNMTTVYVNGTIEIYEAVVFGDNKSADEIREIYKNETLKEFMKENLTKKAEETFNDMMKNIFPNSTTNFNKTRIYINEGSLLNVHEEPIILIADADVFLTRKTYKMENMTKIEDIILGVLKMGGMITKEMNLSADPGHKRIFNFFLPNDIKIVNGTRKIEKIVDNLNGTNYKKSKYNFSFSSESPNPSLKENIFVKMDIDYLDFGELYINISISIESVSIKEYKFPKTISNLTFVSNDGIRLGIETNLTSLNEVYNKSIIEAKEDIEKKLSKVFGKDFFLNFYWDNSTLTGYELNIMKGRDVVCYLNGSIITEEIYKKDKELIRGLVNSGAKIKFNLTLNKKYKYKNELILPENYKLITDKTFVNGKRDIIYFGVELDGFLVYKNAIVYSEEKKFIKTTLDIHTVNLIFIGAVLNSDLTTNIEIYWIEVPNYFAKKLPEEVLMQYVNSDAIRISLQYNMIEIKDIEDDAKNLKEKIEKSISSSFGKDISTIIEINTNSLTNYNIEKMNAEIPIKIRATAKIDFSIEVFSKKALIEFALNFNFENIDNSSTTYKVIFPKEITILSFDDKLKRVKMGSENNRDFIELTLSKGEKDEVKLKLNITLWFILEKLLPWIIFSILLAIVIIYIRKKKKKLFQFLFHIMSISFIVQFSVISSCPNTRINI